MAARTCPSCCVTAISKAVAAGKTKLEVNFPPVPNLDEVRFGTPLNQKFGKTVVAKDLSLPGGYYPGSDIARQQVAFANMHWAKQIAGAVGGGLVGGKPVTVLSAEPVSYDQIKSKGGMSKIGPPQLSGAAARSAAGSGCLTFPSCFLQNCSNQCLDCFCRDGHHWLWLMLALHSWWPWMLAKALHKMTAFPQWKVWKWTSTSKELLPFQSCLSTGFLWPGPLHELPVASEVPHIKSCQVQWLLDICWPRLMPSKQGFWCCLMQPV